MYAARRCGNHSAVPGYSFSGFTAHPGEDVSGFTAHPGEDASAKEEDDWWRITEGVLAATDAAYFIAGKAPPRLGALEDRPLGDYVALTVPAATHATYFKVIEHNRKVADAVAENKRREGLRIAQCETFSRL